MWIDYGERIPEAVAVLQEQVRTERERGVADRLRLLWLLKSGSVRSLGGAAAVQRWWACYAAGGLAALVQRRRRGGSRERISAAAWAALNARLRAGEIARL